MLYKMINNNSVSTGLILLTPTVARPEGLVKLMNDHVCIVTDIQYLVCFRPCFKICNIPLRKIFHYNVPSSLAQMSEHNVIEQLLIELNYR